MNHSYGNFMITSHHVPSAPGAAHRAPPQHQRCLCRESNDLADTGAQTNHQGESSTCTLEQFINETALNAGRILGERGSAAASGLSLSCIVMSERVFHAPMRG